MTNDVENAMNSASANTIRMPKKMVSASSRRYPDCTRRSLRLPSSFADRGAFSPTRFMKPMIDWSLGFSTSSAMRPVVSSSMRRSIAPARLGMRAIAIAAMTIDPNTNASNGRNIVTLHLYLDDLLDPQEADGLHHERARQEHPAERLVEEHVHVIGVDERERDAQHRRQREQDVPGEASVRGVDPDLAQDLEALAHDVREVLQDLRQVAARLPLNQHRGGEETYVEQRHAERQVVERVLHRQAEVLLVERLPELGADRLRHFVRHHLQPGGERVAGLERAGDEVEALGELLLEGPEPLRSLHLEDDEGDNEPDRRAGHESPRRVGDQVSNQSDRHRRAERDDDHAADARFDARLVDPAAERGALRGAADHAVERGHRADMLDLEQQRRGRRCGLRILRQLLQPALELPLRKHARHLRAAKVEADDNRGADGECEYDEDEHTH